MLEVSAQVVGRKDTSKSAFDIWKGIFQKRRSKQERKPTNISNNTSSKFEFLLSLISFQQENVLRLQYYDPMMQRTVKCLENLEVSDIIHKYVMLTQQMSLQA